jgi:plasmid stabilization system protein ParE
LAQVVYSAQALDHIERAATPEEVTAIQSAVDGLASHPLIGKRIDGELRELVISYGKTGYVALYRFVIARDQARVLTMRHQRELGFLP